jgi:hypothetical protein
MEDNCSNGPLLPWHSGWPSNDFEPTWAFGPWPETGEGRPWSLGGGSGRFPVNRWRGRVREKAIEGLQSVGDPI